jgi:hypothetical protein
VLVRLCPEVASSWTDEEVVRRWAVLFPPRGANRAPLEITQAWLDEKLADADFVARARQRLANLGWFVKCLKEPLARLANKQDGCRGAFWQGGNSGVETRTCSGFDARTAEFYFTVYFPLLRWTRNN